MKILPILTLLAFLAGLFLLQSKVVVPLASDIAASDLFLTDTETQANSLSEITPMSNYAFMHCNTHVKNELGSEFTVTLPTEPINAWDIGGYQYVINAEVEISSNDNAPNLKKYVCRIKYEDGSDQEGVMNNENWSVYGLTGLDEV
jgi:hypothetical protein